MTQQSVMELAKSGDPQAIAALINRSLASKGIHATAEIQAECLHIFLKAAQIPNQKAVVTIIHRGMMILQVEQVKRVKILTYRSDNNYLAWQHEFSLGDYQKSAQSEEVEPSEQLSMTQSQNVNLARNPKGVILVQKFSQIQQNSQEYQDIIVRFTDEQVGTVRCLTTLTELIQVISKPSFLFAAVAANPNLRSLLDTIAESSQTDEHGDQVITNLSILQPGQQWQRAKIRLVTKIFLEPNQDKAEATQEHQVITLDLAKSAANSKAAISQDIIAKEIVAELITPEFTNTGIPEAIAISEDQDKNDDIEIIKNSVPTLTTNAELTINSNSITVDSLFDDFPEPNIANTQEVPINLPDTADSLFDDFLETNPIDVQEVKEVNNPTNQAPPSSDSITVDSLFDDFPEPNTAKVQEMNQVNNVVNQDPINLADTADSLFDDFAYAADSPQIISDLTQNTVSGDSLFDDFLVDSTQSFAEVSPQNTSTLTEIPQTEDVTIAEFGDDLFGNFGFEDKPVNSIETGTIETEIEAIKSKIPKQSLDRLLALINEEEPANAPQVLPNQTSEITPDMGMVTIERILGNMNSLTIDKKDTAATLSFVTLEDLSEDLDSVGF
ncbi:MAG: hypothetical protein AUK48_06075 [Oscillatoriales cyanobacterium CG2_30_44_21]|nr:MAG: hypothetical protein AUK48_06075 [Oscillatoriales cyanobacterium CG2_30_44_21]